MMKLRIFCYQCIFTFFNKACPAGYYGLQCESKCVGHCKDSETCNHISGLCDNGCGDGWTGSNCTKGCPIIHVNKECVWKVFYFYFIMYIF